MTNETEVKTIEVRQYCDKCGTELTFTGEVLLSNPLKYVHICEKCKNYKWLPKSYPCIEYKEVQKNPITGIELTDKFKETLERVAAKRNKESVKESKSEEMIFTLTPNEVDEYNKFIGEHKNCKCSATIGYCNDPYTSRYGSFRSERQCLFHISMLSFPIPRSLY